MSASAEGAAGSDAPALTDAQQVEQLARTLAPEVEVDRASARTVESGFLASTEGGSVALPSDPAEAAVTLTSQEKSLQVTLPAEARTEAGQATQSGLTVYPAASINDAAIALEAFEDGSVRVQTLVPNAQAPHEFTYGLSVPTGGRIELTEDGGALVFDAEGAFVAGAASPWAKDATGAEVGTRYEVRGSDLVQVIEPTAQSTYPIVADPWLGQWLVSSVKAVRVSQGTTYQVTPTLLGRTAITPMYSTLYADALRKGLPQQSKYYDQLICHPFSGIARVKGTWNVDSWRPNVGWSRTILAGCNP